MSDSFPAGSADGPDHVPETEAETPRREPLRLSSFTDADVRSFVITIAGTVIGALLTALALGVAVIVAHWYTRTGYPGSAGLYQLGIITFCSLTAWLTSRRSQKRGTGIRIAIGLVVVADVLALLVWVGLAAGIK